MTAIAAPALDDTGKIVLDHIYDKPDPISYFATLGRLDYVIPQEAGPIFRNVVQALRDQRGQEQVKALDLGCSYGVNAAILKCGLSMAELRETYAQARVAELDRAELVARDRALFAEAVADPCLEVAGLDVSAPAVGYALDAGLLDAGIVADLESAPLPAPAASVVAERDLVISTGCVGYISPVTFSHLLDATGDEKPWMVHFVLRMFGFAPFAEVLGAHGYVTETVERTFPQRRFATPEERAAVLDNLATLDIDPAGKEETGWYHADVYLSRPADQAVPAAEDILAARGTA